MLFDNVNATKDEICVFGNYFQNCVIYFFIKLLVDDIDQHPRDGFDGFAQSNFLGRNVRFSTFSHN